MPAYFARNGTAPRIKELLELLQKDISGMEQERCRDRMIALSELKDYIKLVSARPDTAQLRRTSVTGHD
jgi:hypothetical protein